MTYKIVLASFLVQEKLKKVQFFKKTFLLTDIGMEVVLRIPFLIFSNAHMQFIDKKAEWKIYTTVEVLPTIKKLKFNDKSEFVTAPLNENIEKFVVHIIILLGNVMKPDNSMICHIICHVMDPTQSRQFYIITYPRLTSL